MKRKLAIILAAVMLLSLAPVSALAAPKVTVTMNGAAVAFPDGQPYVDKNDRTLVPISPIAQAMGMSYNWNDSTKVATFTKDYTADSSPLTELANETHSANYFLGRETVAFTIGSRNVIYTAYYFDLGDTAKAAPVAEKTYTKTIVMDTTSVLQNHRTYAPVKYLAETLGYTVLWQGSTNTVAIHANPTDNALRRVELVGGSGDHLSFAVFKGRLFDAASVDTIKYNSSKIGTDTCAYQNYTDKEIASIKAAYGDDYLSGTRITEKFISGRTETVELYLNVVYKTGLTVPQKYTIEYTYSGGSSSL